MVLVTGATGLIGRAVVRALVAAGLRPTTLARGGAPGTEELRAYERLGLVRCLWGDLARGPDLGLGRDDLLALESTRHVIHAAACYRLGATAAEVWPVNVDGTAHVLTRASAWPLEAFHHVSSITIAGADGGTIAEAPRARPVRFRNPYEESKWTAEGLVLAQTAAPRTVVHRVGITIGHAATGETCKHDGPYAAFGLMRRGTFFPIPGRGTRTFPLVTVDLVADAIVAGVVQPPAGTTILHVIDRAAPTVRAFATAMTRRLAGHGRAWPLPVSVALAATRLPGFTRLTGLEAVAAEYMCADATFTTDRFGAFCADRGVVDARITRAYDALALRYALETGRAYHAVA